MIHIRKAQAEDAKQIAPIMLLAMQDIIFHFIGHPNQEEAIHFLEHFIARPENQYSYQNILVAEDNKLIIGQICLYDGQLLESLRQPILTYLKEEYNREIELENETEAGEVYLDTIAISLDAQGRGIGKALLQHVIEEFVRCQQKNIGLLVDKENPGAKSLYLRTGFQVIKTKHIFGKEMEHLQYQVKGH